MRTSNQDPSLYTMKEKRRFIYPGLFVDYPENEIVSRLQFFVKDNHIQTQSELMDAKDLLSDEYEDLKDILYWTDGIKRFVFDDRMSPSKRLRTHKNYFYSLINDCGDFMFTCHKDRREMYLYYSEGRENDLLFCDEEYSCFEIPLNDEIISDVCILMALGTCQESDKYPGMSRILAGEFKTLHQKKSLKFKVMPKLNLSRDDVIENSLRKYLTEHKEIR